MKKKQSEKELIQILERRKSKLRWLSFPTPSGKEDWRSFKIIDYVIHQQSDAPQKYFVIDLVKLLWKRKIELRFGYYVIGTKGKTRGKWKWGQFCPFIPPKDFKTLFKKVKNKGWLTIR